MNWHLQDAKNNFSKVVQRARSPCVASARPWCFLPKTMSACREKRSHWQNLLTGPVWDDDFAEEVNRRSDTMIRDIDL
jgi:hypothetical protein